MSKEIPLVEGKEYTATLTITSVGGSPQIRVESSTSTPVLDGREDGADDDTILIPPSYYLMDEVINILMSRLEAEQVPPEEIEEKAPVQGKLRLATHNGETLH
jgi:hypothetical protein